MHNKGLVPSTRGKGTWEYVQYKSCATRSDSVLLESKLKKYKNNKKALEYLRSLGQSSPD